MLYVPGALQQKLEPMSPIVLLHADINFIWLCYEILQISIHFTAKLVQFGCGLKAFGCSFKKSLPVFCAQFFSPPIQKHLMPLHDH